MQSHGMSAGHSSIEEHSRSDHHPRQLFNYHSDQHNFTYGKFARFIATQLSDRHARSREYAGSELRALLCMRQV